MPATHNKDNQDYSRDEDAAKNLLTSWLHICLFASGKSYLRSMDLRNIATLTVLPDRLLVGGLEGQIV